MVNGRYTGERSDGGRIRRESFDTLAEVKKWLSDLGARRNAQGTIATALTAPQVRDAIDAYHALKSGGYEITLCELVQLHIAGVKRKAIGETVAILIDKHLKDGIRRGLRERTLYDKQNRLKSFATLHGERNLGEITKEDVSAWLDGTGATGRNLRNNQTAIQSFFNWCAATVEGYANDVAHFPQDTVKDIEPAEIVTAKTARGVLHAMEKRNPNAALVLAIGLFGGLRTDEITGKAGLQWEDIDFEKGMIFVRAGQAKTRRLRKVPITDNLRAWLVRYRKDAGRVSCCEEVFYEHRSAVCSQLRIEWPKNAARHSFGTFYARLHGAHKAAEIMGHIGGIAMFSEHYEGKPVALAEAQAFFKIEPIPTEGAKIIQLEGVA
jgi:integrase